MNLLLYAETSLERFSLDSFLPPDQPFKGISDRGEGELVGDEVHGVGVVHAVQPEVLQEPGSVPSGISLVLQRLVVQQSELPQPGGGGHLDGSHLHHVGHRDLTHLVIDAVQQVSLHVGFVKEPHVRIS